MQTVMWTFIRLNVIAWALGIMTALIIKFVYRKQAGRCHSNKRLDGQTAIVTGASAGIGKETARDLAARGARVILACRNVEKAQRVAEDIISTTGNGQVIVECIDTSDTVSVRKFAGRILDRESALHILVNNAGVPGYMSKRTTPEGLELAMATNHFGHFLLTNMLLGLMKASGPSRIVNVTSNSHWICTAMDTDDLNYDRRPFPGWLPSYGQSKLANILFTTELAKKLKGTEVTTNSVHPGIVHTEIFWKDGWKIFNIHATLMVWLMAKDEKLGAETVTYLAVSEEVDNTSGEYFVDCKVAPRSELSKNEELASKLWTASERTVNLMEDERHL